MSERASVAIIWCWDGPNLGGGGVIARARPLHLLRDRFARSLRGSLLTRSVKRPVQSVYKEWACVNGWMDGSGTEARDPACLRWLGDGALSTGSTRARCGVLCITAAAFFCEAVCIKARP